MILKKLTSMLRNESGNFAIIFAICAFPAIGAASLALDYSNMSKERNMVQHSLDAAALATAKQMASGTTGEALEQYARDFFDANLPSTIAANRVDLDVNIKTEMTENKDGNLVPQKTLALNASLDYNTFIANVVGQDQFQIGISSQVAMGNMTVEVALVIDNSGSMGGTRINLAKSTAKDLITTVYNASGFSNKTDPVKFALVPFAASVNIGANNANANWMDTRGISPIHNENLDWTTYYTTNQTRWNGASFEEKINGTWTAKTRLDIYSILGDSWDGCVEMRPWPHNAQDTVAFNSAVSGQSATSPAASAADRAKFFVPMLAPAEPGNKKVTNTSGSSSSDYKTYPNDYLGKSSSWTSRADWRVPTGTNSAAWIRYQDYPNSTGTGTNTNSTVRNGGQNQRQNWIWRSQAAKIDNQIPSFNSSFGPNYSCTTNALTPLTTTQSTIENAVDAMQANGNTNIQEGVAWGWRTLSPQEPFTGGREYDDEENRKYMIVLTDGNNTYGTSSSYVNGSTYAPWGYEKHDRIEAGLSSSDLAGTIYSGQNLNTYEKKMNAHTLQTCNNAKAAGVTVFTIAFDVSNGSSVKQMLDACAGSGIVDGKPLMTSGTFYFDVNGTGIQDAMTSIATQISDIRIMK
ncbi:MAG: TadE/TadG family type IV pilus assembly protein [Nitratireductor sp.]